MPVTVSDLYRIASESGEWYFALWTTLLFDDSGREVAKPESEHQRDDLAFKVGALAPFAVGHPYAEEVVEKLLVNIMTYDADHPENLLVLQKADFDWLEKKLQDEPNANPRLKKLLETQSPWEVDETESS